MHVQQEPYCYTLYFQYCSNSNGYGYDWFKKNTLATQLSRTFIVHTNKAITLALPNIKKTNHTLTVV